MGLEVCEQRVVSVLVGPCPTLISMVCAVFSLISFSDYFLSEELCVCVCGSSLPDVGRSQGCAPGCQQLERLGCLHVVWVRMSVCAIASKHQAGLVASMIRDLGVVYWSGPNCGLDAVKVRMSESHLLERL